MTEPSEKDFVKKQPYGWIAAVVVAAIVFFSVGYFVHTPSSTTPTTPSGNGNVTITFYEAMSPSEAAFFESVIVPQFEQNYTNITVAFANLPSTSVPTEIQTLVASNRVGATIAGLDNLAVGDVIYSHNGNILMNLTSIASKMMPSTLIPSAVNMTNYEKTVFGGIYFLPFRSNVPLVFYNKTALLAATGSSTPPATDAQLLTMAKQMDSHGFNGSIMIQGAGPNFENGADTGTQLYQWMVQYGGNPFVLNSTADAQAFDFIYNLSAYFNPAYSGGYWGSYAGLAQNGSYKFLDYQWPYVYPLLTNETYKMNTTTLGVYGGPAGPANNNHLLGGDVLVIPKGATDLYALETFANYLLSPHAQMATLLNLSWVAVNSEAYKNLPASFSDVGNALLTAVNGGVFLRNPTPWINQWNVYASTALDKILALNSYSASGIMSILNTYNGYMYTYLVNNYGQTTANQYEAGGFAPISI